jgi:hypothetical protein
MFSPARAALFTLSVSFLFACTSSEDDGFNIAPGVSYDDTVHVAQGWGVCKNASSYTTYWGLKYANGSGDTVSTRWLGVNMNVDSSVVSATFSVGENTSPGDAAAPAGKASVWMNGVAFGSQASSTAAIKVVVLSADSIQVIGKGIRLQNGRVLNFNLKNGNRCGA